jgi:transposase
MKFIAEKDRNQTGFFCLEEAVSTNNEVRLIDLFVKAINFAKHGFDMKFLDNGRPAYHPSNLLKLFIYGYLRFCKQCFFAQIFKPIVNTICV